MGSKGPGQHDPVDGVDAEFIHQQPRTGIERGFGHLNFANVPIGHRDLRPALRGAIPNEVGIGAPILDDSKTYARWENIRLFENNLVNITANFDSENFNCCKEEVK